MSVAQDAVWRWFQQHATVEPWHVERYVRSWQWIEPVIRPYSRILDCGDGGPFCDWLREQGYLVDQTAPHDLRYPLPLPAGVYDLALCQEVIEHIKDQDHPDNRDVFDGSGIRCLLAELRRVTVTAGRLFLTTPNLCCYRSIQRLLNHEHPHQYPPHPRELAPDDVRHYLAEAGWVAERSELVSVWKDHRVSARERQEIASLARRLYHDDSQLAGDCLFVMAGSRC